MPGINRQMIVCALLLGSVACNPRNADKGAAPPSPALAGLPIEMIVEQRSTTSVPGSKGELELTIDDITDDQVMVSLAGAGGGVGGNVIVATHSMVEGDECTFRFSEQLFRLSLKNLENSMVGTDRATFEIDQTAGSRLSDREKIERLIQSIESLEGATFIRNGDEHSAKDAAKHLRTKLKRAGKRVKTANDFIEGLATQSSMSGKPYQIRFADGRTVACGEFLKKKLGEIEQGA